MPMHQDDFKPARSPCGLHKLWPTLVTCSSDSPTWGDRPVLEWYVYSKSWLKTLIKFASPQQDVTEISLT